MSVQMTFIGMRFLRFTLYYKRYLWSRSPINCPKRFGAQFPVQGLSIFPSMVSACCTIYAPAGIGSPLGS
ncbi:hypothetical protein KTH_49550 [Thermosporothrix hazakensis]|uniref:Uncharacterized protein n=1 Tax=Thermosporothrix sp. COM3 TaxID=2490863 RepID=A0A455SGR7_9CHLR|nr:hypothetical protein KTC_23940 [Thermosporothrix sp. COM3]GCE50086.1 hypothetical protein KTH_49550 [Thermosporothrix hazakensis]